MAFLAIAIFGLIVIIRALMLGGASADAQSIRRDEQPIFYWSILTAGAIVDLFLFYRAFVEFGY